MTTGEWPVVLSQDQRYISNQKTSDTNPLSAAKATLCNGLLYSEGDLISLEW